MSKSLTINVMGTPITVLTQRDEDFISLTDMLKAKDGETRYGHVCKDGPVFNAEEVEW